MTVSSAPKNTTEERGPALLFVNQHYWPDVASTGQHLTDLAEYLAAQGMRVTVLASRARYTAGKMSAAAREERNGVQIRRVRGTAFGRGTIVGRLVDYASFYVRVLRTLFVGPRYDGVVFLTTPPLLGFLGYIARKLRGQHYAVWSMDLHPAAEIGAGMLKPTSLAARLLTWTHDVGVRHADLVIDLGPHMKRRLLDAGVDARRTRTVHVWSSREEIEPTSRDANPIRKELGLSDKFVVMYSGNAGIVHDFTGILDAMDAMKHDADTTFLFVGDGPRRAEIERFVAEHGITNFTYGKYFPREQLRYSLSVGDVHLVSLRAPFVGVSVPGKLYGIMAAGRPVLFVGPARCESAEAVIAADCGAVIDPADGDADVRIAATLRAWREDPALRAAMGARARAAFLERYEREPNCRAFAGLMREFWGAPGVLTSDTRPSTTRSHSARR